MSREHVLQAMQIDYAARQPEGKREIYEYDSVPRVGWDDTLPTLYVSEPCNVHSLPKEEEVIVSLLRRHPALADIDYTHVVVAGGAIARTVMKRGQADVDLFIHSARDEAHLTEILIGLGRAISKSMKNSPTIRRTKNAVTIGDKYQVILRGYEKKEDIVYGFDLGSSAIMYDGSKIYVSEMGRLAYSRLINVVDTTRRSTTYERRLMKYAEIGFLPVLPNLKISALQDTQSGMYREMVYYARLAVMPFSYSKIDGNRITYSGRLYRVEESKAAPISDYEANPDDISWFYYNLGRALQGGGVSPCLEHTDIETVVAPMEWFSEGLLRLFYDNVFMGIQSGVIRVRTIERYMSWIDTSHLLKIYKNREELRKLKQNVIDHARNVCAQYKDEGVKWLIADPGTQLTSSYNPIFEDPVEWYGKEYYNPEP